MAWPSHEGLLGASNNATSRKISGSDIQTWRWILICSASFLNVMYVTVCYVHIVYALQKPLMRTKPFAMGDILDLVWAPAANNSKTHNCTYQAKVLYGGFLKWGYLKIDGL